MRRGARITAMCLRNIFSSETSLVSRSEDVPEPQIAESRTVSTAQGKYPSLYACAASYCSPGICRWPPSETRCWTTQTLHVTLDRCSNAHGLTPALSLVLHTFATTYYSSQEEGSFGDLSWERNTRTLTFLHYLVYAFLSYPPFIALHIVSHCRAFAGWKEEVVMEDMRQECILNTEKTVYTQNEISALSVCSSTLLNSLLIVS